jgi:molybdate transport system substrate-binding protein
VRNSLVLVAASDFKGEVKLEKGFDFAGSFKGPLAIGDPAHVPAGEYAKQILSYYEWWKPLDDSKRLAMGANISAVLNFVERGEAELGIVFKTEANCARTTRILLEFPAESHQSAQYRLVVITPGKESSARLADFILNEGAEFFYKEGFQKLEK